MKRKLLILNFLLVFLLSFISIAHADWTVTPTSINFGDVPVGTSKTVALVITNTGTTALTFNIYSSIPEVTTDTIGTAPISAGQSVTIAVTFKPTARGSYSGELVIVANDATQPSATVTFTGTSSYATGIDVSPTSINFGIVEVGKTKSEFVKVTNNGKSDLNVTAITSGEPFQVLDNYQIVDSIKFTLRPGESRNIIVGFFPQKSGTYSGALYIISDDANTPRVVVSLVGSTTQEFGLTFFPSIINFGYVTINTSYERTLRLYNTSSDIINVTLSIQNINGSAFSLPSTTPVSFTMIPGEMRQVTVRFSPTSKMNYSGFLFISTAGGTARISLLGIGSETGTGGLEPQNPPPSSGSGGGGGGCSVSGRADSSTAFGSTLLMTMPLIAIAFRRLIRKIKN